MLLGNVDIGAGSKGRGCDLGGAGRDPFAPRSHASRIHSPVRDTCVSESVFAGVDYYTHIRVVSYREEV
jgi:hypothetical protein